MNPVNFVFIVCGGFKVSISDMVEYQRVAAVEMKEKSSTDWEVRCEAETWHIHK
jgi:L-serine/L-threonine ammonia-lyase